MNLNFSGPINHTGYGVSSFGILKELSKKHDIAYFPKGNPSVDSQEEYDLVSTLMSKQNSFDINAPFLKIWHQFDLADRIGRGRYYAYPFFELDTFNEREKKHLSVPDEIFVSSEWAKNVVINNGINNPVSVVPLGVNREVFHENIPNLRNDGKYVFLAIGKWEVRKSHDILPELFKKAFGDSKDVELWILAAEHTNSYSSSEEIMRWKALYNSPNIRVIPGVETQRDVANIIAHSDCGLYISRAEGWNLELLETMSMNKPTIATNYSAHTEFCNKENSYLIDIDETEKAFDGKAFNGQGNWAKIGKRQKDQTIEYMRHLYKNDIRVNPEGIKMAKKLSWDNSANIISRCIF
jgi:glycosyltransferase involved in cell wall biosynthesis